MNALGEISVIMRNVSVVYEQWDVTTAALSGVSIVLPRTGHIMVRGPNASGKSTLLKVIAGSLRPTSGSVRVFGEDPARMSPNWRAKRIGFVGQQPEADLVSGLMVYEHVRLMGHDWSTFESELGRLDPSGQFSFLADCRRQPVERLSGGQRQTLGLALQLVRPTSLLLLDEPFAALDPQRLAAFAEVLDRLAKERCIVHVTHVASLRTASDLALQLCDGRAWIETEALR